MTSMTQSIPLKEDKQNSIELQLQNIILKRVHKELHKMPDQSHNISFCLRLLIDQLRIYLDHITLHFPSAEQEKIKEYLILQFQAFSGVMAKTIESYPDENQNYYDCLRVLNEQLGKYRVRVRLESAEWR